jgi:hypothetical protein
MVLEAVIGLPANPIDASSGVRCRGRGWPPLWLIGNPTFLESAGTLSPASRMWRRSDPGYRFYAFERIDSNAWNLPLASAAG